MSGPVIMLVSTIVGLMLLVFWNKKRVSGKMLCSILRKDKSVIHKLCELRDDFVIFENRAYDVYPDFVRVTRYPSGWPNILQELVPTSLYEEEDAIPLHWINLGDRLERSMQLRAALDENWMKKLVHEAAVEGSGFNINWRKILPILLMLGGAAGLLYIIIQGKVLG